MSLVVGTFSSFAKLFYVLENLPHEITSLVYMIHAGSTTNRMSHDGGIRCESRGDFFLSIVQGSCRWSVHLSDWVSACGFTFSRATKGDSKPITYRERIPTMVRPSSKTGVYDISGKGVVVKVKTPKSFDH